VETPSRFTDDDGGWFQTHLFSFEIPFQGIEEKTVMWDGKPVENFLFFLCPNTLILEEQVKEGRLWLFERGVVARFEISEVTKYTLLKLFHIPNGTRKSLETKDESANNIGSGDMIEAGPENTRDVFTAGEEEAVKRGVLTLGRAWRRLIRRSPTRGGCSEEKLESLEMSDHVLLVHGQRTGNYLRNRWERIGIVILGYGIIGGSRDMRLRLRLGYRRE
jgi:hypothetical protein